jgi:hypothetical protein
VTPAIIATAVSLTRHNLSAGPVVGVLAVLTLLAVLTVLAFAYLMHLRDRR